MAIIKDTLGQRVNVSSSSYATVGAPLGQNIGVIPGDLESKRTRWDWILEDYGGDECFFIYDSATEMYVNDEHNWVNEIIHGCNFDPIMLRNLYIFAAAEWNDTFLSTNTVVKIFGIMGHIEPEEIWVIPGDVYGDMDHHKAWKFWDEA